MKKNALILIIATVMFTAAGTALAANFGLDETAGQAGYETTGTSASIPGRVQTIISTVLGFVSLGFFGLTLYGGFIWLTARGKEEKVTQAKEIMEAAVIGLVVIGMSYAISRFILSRLGG